MRTRKPRLQTISRAARRHLSPGCLALILFSAMPVMAQSPDPAPGPSVAGEIRSAAGGKLKPFYRATGFQPLWIRNGVIGPEADRLLKLLETADLDGLDPDDYDVEDLRRVIAEAKGGSSEALARADIRLSKAFAAYVRDVRRPPAIKITYLDAELEPEELKPAAILRAAAIAPSFPDYMRDEGWVSPVYAGLRDALGDYLADWAHLPAVTIPAGPPLRPGAKDDRVRLLRARLGLPEGSGFDKALTARVKAFQAAHGLAADGLPGSGTIAALNRGPAYNERIVRLNLERARLLPSPWKRHIVVDAAAARLWMYEDGKAVDTMKVIVGKPEEPTPMLAGMMRYVVVNPYWNMPTDLVRRRVGTAALNGRSLRSMGFEALSDWSSNARVLDQSEIDWSAVVHGEQEVRVRQLPGGTNAMGRVKFMFPNDLGIYLHDTPEKQLFKKDERRFSAGCVRVEDAQRLARWLFGKPLVAPSDAPEQQVGLPAPMPVYITYLTAAPAKGGIAFRDDAYGRDAPQGRMASR